MISSKFITPNKPERSINDEPLDTPKLVSIYGPTGSGKSVLLMNLLAHLEKIHKWDEALFVTGNGQDPLLKTLEMNVTTNPNELSTWMTSVSQKHDSAKYNLLVLDDILGHPSFNVFTNRGQFAQFVISHRHLGAVEKNGVKKGGTWIIMTSQRFAGSFSPAVKDQVNIWMMFYPRVQTELNHLLKLGDDQIMTKRAFDLLRKEGKYNFLMLNKDFSPSQFFMNWNKHLQLDV